MRYKQLLISAMAALVAGTVFAQGDLPVSIVNQLRFGYDDNIYRTSGAGKQGSYFIEDIIDLSYNAAFTDRTDMQIRGRARILADKHTTVHPSLFFTLNHAATPRLLLSLSDMFTTGERNEFMQTVGRRRYNFWRNVVKLDSDYVLTEKDRIGASVSHTIDRSQHTLAEVFDFTRYTAGLSWTRELVPSTTLGAVWEHSRVEYDNLDAKLISDSLYSELRHAFNPEWIGAVRGGVTFANRKFAQNSKTTSPLFGAGLAYNPSPRTRLTADLDFMYDQTDNQRYGGQEKTQLKLGAEHEITARVAVRSTVRMVNSEYDAKDRVVAAPAQKVEEDRFDWDTRVSYKLNRIHFLEAGYRFSRRDYSNRDNWTNNRVDIGWRAEF